MSLPLVTVVIPAYNSAAYVCEAIDSVLSQDYRAIEVVMADDGSTDDTVATVRSRYDDRVRVVCQEHRGPGAARNLGIAEGAGEFVAFLDSDDLWLPGRLSKCLTPMLDDADVGMTFCWTEERWPDGTRRIHNGRQERRRLFPRRLWPSMLQTTPGTTVRRSVLQGVGLFDEALGSRQDQDLWIRLGEACRAVEVPEALCVYRIRSDSLTRTARLEQREADYLAVMDRAFDRRPDLYEPHRDVLMAEARFEWGLAFLIEGRHREARRRLAESSRLWPTRRAALYRALSYAPAPIVQAVRKARWRLAHARRRSRVTPPSS